jgi:NADPH:quinone reductase
MRAARVLRHGEPADVVAVEDVAEPVPGPGEVRVRVAAASLNHGDVARCRGGVTSAIAAPPFTLGMDVCGVVDAAGDGAGDLVGARVAGITAMAMGGLAELAVVPMATAFPAPPELDDAEAAAFLLPFHLSHVALHRRAVLRGGEWLLVLGAASGVGTAAIQVGAAAGAHVIASAGGAAKAELCRELGAAITVDHHSDDLFQAVMDATDGTGADVVLDLVGGEATEAVWTCVARGGRYVAAGFNDDPMSGMTGRPLRRVSMGNFSVVGVLLAYSDDAAALRPFGFNPFSVAEGQQVHRDLVALVAAGTVRPFIGRRITLDDVGPALGAHAERRTMGRTVVELPA